MEKKLNMFAPIKIVGVVSYQTKLTDGDEKPFIKVFLAFL